MGFLSKVPITQKPTTMKLFGIYNVISNKTVRTHEDFYKKFKFRNKYVLGTLIQTNRGYFINAHNVDLASAELWKKLNNNADLAKEAKAAWNKQVEEGQSNED